MEIQDLRRIGIQGGRGSFNDQAVHKFLTAHGIGTPKVDIQFLFTTPRVLAALRDGEIDAGQFAVHNTINGPVVRSVEAMDDFHFPQHFAEVARCSLPISHCLMIHPAASLMEIDTIISHPTVFIQCERNLLEKYPNLSLTPGAGDLEDPARAGEAIARGELPRNYATLSSKRIAEIFDLTVIAEDLQDQNPFIQLKG